MELHEFGPDDVGSVDTFVAITAACDEQDCPWEVPLTRASVQRDLRFGWDGELPRYFLLRDGGTDVGTLCYYGSERDNPELAWVDLKIRPERRRAGLGRAAADAVFRFCREHGRPLVILERGWDSPAVRGFAASLDFPLAQVTVRRVQELTGDAAETARFTALRAEAEEHSGGYDLVRVLGRTPPELLDGLVAVTEAINDAPHDDLEYNDEAYDVDRIRLFEQAQADAGFRLHRVLAVERATGAVAGHTVLSVYGDQPQFAEQDDTTVLGEHRGHRLGLRLKADMLCWLAETEPQVRRILTENAESNDPMIAVNERLGYTIAGRQLLHQRRLD